MAVDDNETPRSEQESMDLCYNSDVEKVFADVLIKNEEWDVLAHNNDPSGFRYSAVYFEGETIVQEGGPALFRIFRIKSGTCIVSKLVPNAQEGEPSSATLGTLREGDLFGEVSFFSNSNTTATVMASSLVELQIIDGHHLRMLSKDNLGLVLKFYYLACSNMAQRIRERENDGWARFEKYALTPV